MVDTTDLVTDTQNVPIETTEDTETKNSISNTESFPEELQVQICSASEKSEPQTTEEVAPIAVENENSKNDISNETVSSVEDSPAEPETQSSNIVNSNLDVVDSSTSQEEVSESKGKSLENIENSSQHTEVENVDKAVAEAQPKHDDIPMEVDIVNESESKDKVIADEPSSTSTDINL